MKRLTFKMVPKATGLARVSQSFHGRNCEVLLDGKQVGEIFREGLVWRVRFAVGVDGKGGTPAELGLWRWNTLKVTRPSIGELQEFIRNHNEAIQTSYCLKKIG